MRKKYIVILMILAIGFVPVGNLFASQREMTDLGEKVVELALKKLSAKAGDKNMACLTNAGWVKHKGRSTRILFDVISQRCGISLGKSTLLPVHSRFDDKLWFAFIKKESEKDIRLTYLEVKDDGLEASPAINVYINKEQPFEPFGKLLGKRVFSILTLTNAWSEGFPEDLLAGALFHDHFCCGVATGYFTTRFMEKKLPLSGDEKYTYIGSPGWCQDDYIISYLNLTPGKHGYYIMEYPWWRPWKTADKVYTDLGGVVICFDHKANKGKAYVLKFDWQWEDFKVFVGMPDLKPDWKESPWLHIWYNKFLRENMGNPEKFVSVQKEAHLSSKNDYDNLVLLGKNPLSEILGEDKTWNSDNN